MTILAVVQAVCEVVGVARPTSIFSGLTTNRTMQEMLENANEMAQRIASDAGHDWTVLKKTPPVGTFVGDGIQTTFPLPADYKRMLLTTNVRLSSAPKQWLRFIPDYDQWVERRLNGDYDGRGEWTIAGGNMEIAPAPSSGVTISFAYIDKNCVTLTGPPVALGTEFIADTDTFRLDERLLKLGMIANWKQNKGTPYAEDYGTYGDALAMAMGKDSPAPIIIDRRPSSWSDRVSGSWPATWGP